MSRVRASERPSERPSIREAIKRPSKGHPSERPSIKEAIREVIKRPAVSSSKQQRADVQRAATSSILVYGWMSTVDRDALRDALIERLVVANTILVLEART